MSAIGPDRSTIGRLALAAAVKDHARQLGFDRVAIGPAERPEHGDAFERWLDAGYAGTMRYLDRTREDRLDPRRLLPGARSVVAVALVYNPGDPDGGSAGQASHARPRGSGEATGDRKPALGRIARYARGRDYHGMMRTRVRALADFIEAEAGAVSRAAVDTSAVLERDLAARAGLGWAGKNTNLIAPDLGSWFFIGIVLTTAEMDADAREPDRCGTCRACLDACPTEAFVAPWVLDARRCVSYLTIEHRGEIDPALRDGVGDWLFGCDVCQDVCPWNRRAPVTREEAFAAPPAPLDAREILALDDESLRARLRGTPLRRAGRAGLARNAALVLGNTGSRAPGADPIAPLLRAAEHPEPTVRDAARWALDRLDAADRCKNRAHQAQECNCHHSLTGLSLAPLMDSQAARQHMKGADGMADMNREQKSGQGHGPGRRDDQESGQPIQLDPEDEKVQKDKSGQGKPGQSQHGTQQGGGQHGAGQKR